MTRDKRDGDEPLDEDQPTQQRPRRPRPGVRERAVRHLRRILVTTAATGAAVGVAAACGSDVETEPGTGVGGSAGSAATGGIGGTGGTTGGGGEGGDVVCDPLPDPLVCDNDPDTTYFMEYAYWSGQWQQSGSDLVVHVTVYTYTYDGDTLEFSADPAATDGTVQAVDRQPNELQFDVLPDAGASAVVVTVPLDCNGIDEQLLLSLDVSNPGSVGESVSITPGE